MVVLPAVLVLAERRGLLRARERAGRPRLRLPRRGGRVERAPAA
jgi:hypothetical protein